MALIKCRECSSDVSTEAKACPKCGAGIKRKTGVTGWLLLGMGAFFIYSLFSGITSSPDKPDSKKTSLAQETPKPNSEAVNKQIAIDGINIKKPSWRKGGFNSVMVVSLTLENSGKNAVKDISLKCFTYGNSGTELNSNTKVIYELVPAGKSKFIKDLSMGFIGSQASSANCRVTDLKFECSSATPCRF